MTNINVAKNSDRYKFVSEFLGTPHMTVFNDGREIAVWYVSEDDKKVLEEMEKEKSNSGYTIGELLFCLFALSIFTLFCLGIYAIIHFVIKFW